MSIGKDHDENEDWFRTWNKVFKEKVEESFSDIKDFYEQNTNIRIIIGDSITNDDPLSYIYDKQNLYDCEGKSIKNEFPNVMQVAKKIYGDLIHAVHLAERFADDLLGIK
jgi:hypothetical protein